MCNREALMYRALKRPPLPDQRDKVQHVRRAVWRQSVSEHITALARWALAWRADLDALKRALSDDKAHAEIRRYAAAALNYVVSRMDLIPDWERAVGLFDDVMVMRICAAQGLSAAGPGGSGVDEETACELARLAQQTEPMQDFLGDDLYGKLRAYCDRLTQQEVRGRTPDQLLADAGARAQLYAEVDAVADRATDISVPDPAHAAVRLKAYLGHKLK
jgi:uncharacterized membrane protein YkvA (DUF1232 family)